MQPLHCTQYSPNLRRVNPDPNPHTDPLRLAGPRVHTFTFRTAPRSFLGRVAAAVTGAVALIVALAFSVVAFAVVAVAAAVGGAWLWWKTRDLRRALRERPNAPMGGRPGEREVQGDAVVIRVDDAR